MVWFVYLRGRRSRAEQEAQYDTCGLVWLPDRKTIPGRAGGTVRDMAVTVAIPIYGQYIVLTRY